MRVAYIYQAPGLALAEPKAPAVHISGILNGLHGREHAVSLLTLYNRGVFFSSDLPALRNRQVRMEHLGRLGLSSQRAFLLFESAVRRVQGMLRLPYLALFDSFRIYDALRCNASEYDVFHERYNLLGLGATWASRRLNKPLVLEFNGDYISELESQGSPLRGFARKYAIWTTRQALKQASKIICVSQELKEHVIRVWHLPGKKIHVLPNATDVELFGQDYQSDEVRAGWGLDHNPAIIFVGGFYSWHDLGLLVDSFARVLDIHPDARLILVGDGKTRPQVEDRIAEHKINGQVIFTGKVPHERIPALLAAAQIAVAPQSHIPDGYGCSPLKLYEYMAAGKAIIASRTGQASQIIQHEVNGLLVGPGDVAGFSDALIRLLDDAQLAERTGQTARLQAIEKHSWNSYAHQLEDVYRDVLKPSTGDTRP